MIHTHTLQIRATYVDRKCCFRYLERRRRTLFFKTFAMQNIFDPRLINSSRIYMGKEKISQAKNV